MISQIISSPENQGRYSSGTYDGSTRYISSGFLSVKNVIESVERTNDVIVEQYEWVVASQKWAFVRDVVHSGGVSIRTFDVNYNEIGNAKYLSKGTPVSFTADNLAPVVDFIITFEIDGSQVVNANIHPTPPEEPPENPDTWKLYYCLKNSINIEYVYHEWIIGDSPHSHYESAEIFEPDYPTDSMPAAMWRVDPSYNNNRPYNELMRGVPYNPPPVIKSVKQRPYITVYSYRTPQNGFDNHGLYILTPTRCTIVEALNGRYELSIEHPIDPEGRWEYIRENNIIKALGQLFTVRSVTQKWQGRSGKITAKADHIFYQLSDIWIEKNVSDITGEAQGISGRTVIELFNKARQRFINHHALGQTWYSFTPQSDMTVPDVLGDNKWEFLKDGMTPVDFLMGNNGVLEACGGRLHRDNFRFSIYERKEGSKDNAFEIRVGKNLTGISRTIDASSLITYLKAWDNFGNWFAVSWVGSEDIGMPHYTVREKEFSYSLKDYYYRDESAVAAQMLAQDALDYFNANCAPLISYDIDLVDIKNNPEYEDLQLADEFKVGNRGYIYDERIGGKVLIEITETTTDAMTGEVTNVLFGSKRSFMNAWNRTAIIDIEVEPEEIGFVVTDAEGAFVYDSEGSRIVEYEGV